MSNTFIEFSIRNGVGKIVLNRPDVLNSFNIPMGQEVQAALRRCREDAEIRAVLLTGSGRAFCAGQDLAEAAPQDKPWPPIRSIVEATYNPIILAIRQLEKPVIAAVNGVAAGAGANLALACDIVLTSQKASFIQAFCHIGLIPDSGGTFFLPRLVGFGRASALSLLGEKISADEALQMGMIYKVLPPEELEAAAGDMAAHLATRPTQGLGLIKRALNQSLVNDLESQLLLEADLQASAGTTEDYEEGVKAFLEKRQPQFTGK